MTDPTPALSTPTVQAPAGIRIASTLCWVVGILTILFAIATGIPAIAAGHSIMSMMVDLTAGGAVCAAAVLIRRRRKAGVLVLVLAWGLPTAVSVLAHQPARGNLLLLAATLLAAANWKHFT